MTTQRNTTTRPASDTHVPVRRPNLRTAVAIAGVAALIATGASVGSAANDPEAVPTSATGTVVSEAQRLREYRETIIALYGNHPTQARSVNPGTRARRELRSSVAGQYGHSR